MVVLRTIILKHLKIIVQSDERLIVRFLIMAIKIQQYNGNNYNYLPPTYASSSTQAENSDKLDGYHATDFLKENQLGSI